MNTVAYILVLIGGLNWGLDAIGYNLVELLTGEGTTITKIVYILVGLSAVWLIVEKVKNKKTASSTGTTM